FLVARSDRIKPSLGDLVKRVQDEMEGLEERTVVFQLLFQEIDDGFPLLKVIFPGKLPGNQDNVDLPPPLVRADEDLVLSGLPAVRGGISPKNLDNTTDRILHRCFESHVNTPFGGSFSWLKKAAAWACVQFWSPVWRNLLSSSDCLTMRSQFAFTLRAPFRSMRRLNPARRRRPSSSWISKFFGSCSRSSRLQIATFKRISRAYR